jgi:hypothetical protein
MFLVAKVHMAAQGVPTRPNQHSLKFLMSCGGSVVGTLVAAVCGEWKCLRTAEEPEQKHTL